MVSEQEQAEIEAEIAGEIDAIEGDVNRKIHEAVAAKEAEIVDLRTQVTQARKDGAAIAIAVIKRRLGIF